MTDMQHFLSGKKFKLIWSHVRVEDDSTITGYHLINGWGKERHLYFAARFAALRQLPHHERRPGGQVRQLQELPLPQPPRGGRDQSPVPRAVQDRGGRNDLRQGGRLRRQRRQRPAKPRRGDSTQGLGLRENRPPHAQSWDRELRRIEIDGSPAEKETFYTAMYHLFLAASLDQDVNGEYRGLDSNIHRATGFRNHTVFSLWDTYRATHPLFALIQAPRDADSINSLRRTTTRASITSCRCGRCRATKPGA